MFKRIGIMGNAAAQDTEVLDDILEMGRISARNYTVYRVEDDAEPGATAERVADALAVNDAARAVVLEYGEDSSTLYHVEDGVSRVIGTGAAFGRDSEFPAEDMALYSSLGASLTEYAEAGDLDDAIACAMGPLAFGEGPSPSSVRLYLYDVHEMDQSRCPGKSTGYVGSALAADGDMRLVVDTDALSEWDQSGMHGSSVYSIDLPADARLTVQCELDGPDIDALRERGLAVWEETDGWPDHPSLARFTTEAASVMRAATLGYNGFESTFSHSEQLDMLEPDSDAWNTRYQGMSRLSLRSVASLSEHDMKVANNMQKCAHECRNATDETERVQAATVMRDAADALAREGKAVDLLAVSSVPSARMKAARLGFDPMTLAQDEHVGVRQTVAETLGHREIASAYGAEYVSQCAYMLSCDADAGVRNVLSDDLLAAADTWAERSSRTVEDNLVLDGLSTKDVQLVGADERHAGQVLVNAPFPTGLGRAIAVVRDPAAVVKDTSDAGDVMVTLPADTLVKCSVPYLAEQRDEVTARLGSFREKSLSGTDGVQRYIASATMTFSEFVDGVGAARMAAEANLAEMDVRPRKSVETEASVAEQPAATVESVIEPLPVSEPEHVPAHAAPAFEMPTPFGVSEHSDNAEAQYESPYGFI